MQLQSKSEAQGTSSTTTVAAAAIDATAAEASVLSLVPSQEIAVQAAGDPLSADADADADAMVESSPSGTETETQQAQTEPQSILTTTAVLDPSVTNETEQSVITTSVSETDAAALIGGDLTANSTAAGSDTAQAITEPEQTINSNSNSNSTSKDSSVSNGVSNSIHMVTADAADCSTALTQDSHNSDDTIAEEQQHSGPLDTDLQFLPLQFPSNMSNSLSHKLTSSTKGHGSSPYSGNFGYSSSGSFPAIFGSTSPPQKSSAKGTRKRSRVDFESSAFAASPASNTLQQHQQQQQQQSNIGHDGARYAARYIYIYIYIYARIHMLPFSTTTLCLPNSSPVLTLYALL